MEPPSYYTSQVEAIVGSSFSGGQLELTIRGDRSDTPKVIRQIQSMQRKLRNVKKQVRMVCGEIKAAFNTTPNPTLGTYV